jgi:hypothetical protein
MMEFAAICGEFRETCKRTNGYRISPRENTDMGNIGVFTPWKLVIGILFSGTERPASLDSRLEAEFGPIDYKSPVLPFTFTGYYREEMGGLISRRFIGFQNLVGPEHLADIKITTNRIEEEYLAPPPLGRQVNLDPGILNLSRFLLATTKDNSHRVPLQKGIYAELTLRFVKKDFRTLPWTYPDYATRGYRDILIKIREIFKDNLKR